MFETKARGWLEDASSFSALHEPPAMTSTSFNNHALIQFSINIHMRSSLLRRCVKPACATWKACTQHKSKVSLSPFHSTSSLQPLLPLNLSTNMPKATRSKTASSRADPISKPDKKEAEKPTSKSHTKTKTASDDGSSNPSPPKEKAARKDTGKNSHLYTDDNPSTTLHGTGFKDADTANHTLSLVSKRSLTYQFQTINTLYHRASNHPSIKKAKDSDDGPQGMRDALAIFKKWLDETYPAAKAALRVGGGFKPLVSKSFVTKILPTLEANKGKIGSDALEFAKLYASLPKNRRLGNVLLDDEKPGEADWEVKRYEALAALVPEDKEETKGWDKADLWDGEGGLSTEHMTLVAWAWSPVGDRGLAKVEV
jgi:hypothetical protein